MFDLAFDETILHLCNTLVSDIFSLCIPQKSPCYRSLFIVQIFKNKQVYMIRNQTSCLHGGCAHMYTNAFLWLSKVLHQAMTYNRNEVTKTQHIQSLALLTDACTCTHTNVRQVNKQKTNKKVICSDMAGLFCLYMRLHCKLEFASVFKFPGSDS